MVTTYWRAIAYTICIIWTITAVHNYARFTVICCWTMLRIHCSIINIILSHHIWHFQRSFDLIKTKVKNSEKMHPFWLKTGCSIQKILTITSRIVNIKECACVSTTGLFNWTSALPNWTHKSYKVSKFLDTATFYPIAFTICKYWCTITCVLNHACSSFRSVCSCIIFFVTTRGHYSKIIIFLSLHIWYFQRSFVLLKTAKNTSKFETRLELDLVQSRSL